MKAAPGLPLSNAGRTRRRSYGARSAMTDEGEQSKLRTTQASIRRRARSLRWRASSRFNRRRSMRESERWHHEHVDARDNAETRLPTDERVRWPGFWMTEIYGPSHARA